MAVAERMYARALFEAAQDEAGSVPEVQRELADFVRGDRRDPGAAGAAARTRSSTRASRSRRSRRSSATRTSSSANFLLVLTEKGRAGELERSAGVRAARRRARGQPVARARDGVRALRRRGATEIVEQIEHASGRTVEATRAVDPDLIGGIVLQAGSLRLDASVRGRLERLRQEL